MWCAIVVCCGSGNSICGIAIVVCCGSGNSILVCYSVVCLGIIQYVVCYSCMLWVG